MSRQKLPEIVFVIWALLALAILFPVAQLLNGSFPILTVVWILIPLGAVLLKKDARRIGFRPIPWRQLAQTTAINLGGLLLIMLVMVKNLVRHLEISEIDTPPSRHLTSTLDHT